jgi:hypothetical protein
MVNKKTIGKIVFFFGIALMIAAIFTGKFIIPAIQDTGLQFVLEGTDLQAKFLFSFFGAGFPLGAGATIIGAAIFAKAGRKRLWYFFWVLLLAAVILSILPELLTGQKSLVFHGVCCGIILIVFVIITWFWARNRIKLSRLEQLSTDLKMAGLFFFVIGSWELCGLGVLPFFTFYPESIQDYQSLAFAVAQTKLVLFMFSIGWIFILASFIEKYRVNKKE